MAGRNSMDSKAMGNICDALKVCHKSDQLLYLPNNTAALQCMCTWNYLKKPQELGVHITTMQPVKLRAIMQYLTSKHLGPKLNMPLEYDKLCCILQRSLP